MNKIKVSESGMGSIPSQTNMNRTRGPLAEFFRVWTCVFFFFFLIIIFFQLINLFIHKILKSCYIIFVEKLFTPSKWDHLLRDKESNFIFNSTFIDL